MEKYIPPRTSETIPHPLPEGIEGVYRLIDAARNRKQQALISFCGLIGCRISEALTLRPIDFNFPEHTVTIRGKGDKTRVVPYGNRAWEAMAHQVITVVNDNPKTAVCAYQDRFARKTITDLGVRAGLRRHISSHDLRATFATELLNRGTNIRVVQELLGHASVSTTEIYTGVRLDQMRQAVDL